MIKRKKRSPKKKLKDECDTLWSECVKLLAMEKCEKCGKMSYLNSHHVYSRSNLALRWDLENGICLCSGCHCLNNESAHKAPMEFTKWIIEARGKDWADKLSEKSNTINKYIDMDELKLKLTLTRNDLLVGKDMRREL